MPVEKKIIVEEIEQSGWRLTGLYADGEKKDGATYEYFSDVDEVKVIWFLNTFTPSSQPTSACGRLSASITSGTAPLTVTFIGYGSDSEGAIQEYEFNFGDSSGNQPQLVRQTSSTASHRYENPGQYIASLLVKDSRGNWVGSEQNCRININVYSQPQVLGATAPSSLPPTGSHELSLGLFSLFPLLIGSFLRNKFKLV